jgi:hypothetical protein
MFESKTAFNEWHKEHSKYPKEAYTFEGVKEQVGEVSHACQNVKRKIENILEVAADLGFDDFRVCIQGKHNYRNDYVSKYVSYKGQRQDKPLMFNYVYAYTQKKYKDKVFVVNGEETDDLICRTAWQNWNPKGSVQDSNILIAYVDKDICQNSPGALLNYFQLESGAFWNTHQMQYKGFWGSVLTGDAADNIDGILELGPDTKRKYGIKTNGCGKISAARILSTVENELDAATRVIEAYKESWPDDYMERLQDMCFFLWLRRKEGEMFSFTDYLETLKKEHQ